MAAARSLTLSDSFGTHIDAACYIISATEFLWLGTDMQNYGAILGHALKQSGRPFSSSVLNAGATFYGEMEGPAAGVYSGARVGTIAPASVANTFTMAYTESGGASSVDNTGSFIIDVGIDGRTTTADSASGAASVFYFVSANRGFIVGSTVVASDSQRKFFGTFEPQTGTPFGAGTLDGDFILGTEPPESLGGDVGTGVVHIDGAGNGTVLTDSKLADGTLSGGVSSTWALTEGGGGSPSFTVAPSTGQAYVLTLLSPTKAPFLSSPPLTQWPNLFLLEKDGPTHPRAGRGGVTLRRTASRTVGQAEEPADGLGAQGTLQRGGPRRGDAARPVHPGVRRGVSRPAVTRVGARTADPRARISESLRPCEAARGRCADRVAFSPRASGAHLAKQTGRREAVMIIAFGQVAPGFEGVRDAFERNFAKRGEIGAAVAAYWRGQKVVDLWGGRRTPGGTEPWNEDTLVVVMSSTKGLSAMTLAVANARGWLDYEAPVARYWPEFAQNGKGAITVRQLLGHEAGLVLLDEKLTIDRLRDLDDVAHLLARQKPAWPPGTRRGYHTMSLGLYMQELIRHVDPTKRTLGRFFHEEIAAPLGLEFYIGLPRDIPDERLAKMKTMSIGRALLALPRTPPVLIRKLLQPGSLLRRSMLLSNVDWNDRSCLEVEVPAGNGVGTARAMARAYSAFAEGGVELGITPETLARITAAPNVVGKDVVIGVPSYFSLGFLRPGPGFSFGSSSRTFGSPGAGGSFAFADPDARLGYAYVMNKMDFWLSDDPREKALRDAVYRGLRMASSAPARAA